MTQSKGRNNKIIVLKPLLVIYILFQSNDLTSMHDFYTHMKLIYTGFLLHRIEDLNSLWDRVKITDIIWLVL